MTKIEIVMMAVWADLIYLLPITFFTGRWGMFWVITALSFPIAFFCSWIVKGPVEPQIPAVEN